MSDGWKKWIKTILLCVINFRIYFYDSAINFVFYFAKKNYGGMSKKMGYGLSVYEKCLFFDNWMGISNYGDGNTYK